MFTFKLRRGTAAQWTAANPVLHPGEPGVELDTGKFKIGNGFDNWSELAYFPNEDAIQQLIDDLVVEGVKGDKGDPGDTAYQVAVENGFVGDVTDWLLSLKGDDGDQGLRGEDGADGTDGTNGADGRDGFDGLDAYQVAVENGFVGNQAAWLASLKGEKGDQGDPGTPGVKGDQGDPGTDGADGADYTGPNIVIDDEPPGDTTAIWIDISS